jgi:hypothetical protein
LLRIDTPEAVPFQNKVMKQLLDMPSKLAWLEGAVYGRGHYFGCAANSHKIQAEIDPQEKAVSRPYLTLGW